MAISNLDLSPDEKFAQKLEAGSVAKTKSPVSSDKPVSQSADQQIDKLTDQSVDQSTDQLTGPPVDRPVAFYLPIVIHKKIDEAVRYFQEKRHKKIDRSAVVSALLGNPNIWTNEALDRLTDRVVDQLTNRLTSRLTG